MERHWKLRDELYNAFHRWQVMLAALFIGCLLGWGLSYVWPSHYRAASQIYLALNPYRRYSDTMFEALANPKYSNLDNYQYWQMSQLQAAIYMDSFLQPTLDRLRLMDPYWEGINLAELRLMLSSEWRSTGDWSLIADHPDPRHASQAAQVWSDVAVDEITKAVEAARQTFMVDQQLQAGEDELLQINLRQKNLSSVVKALQEWQKSALMSDSNMVLDPSARWQLLALATAQSQFTPAWVQVMEYTPPAEAPLQAYLDWIDQIISLIQTETASLEAQVLSLDQKQIELARRFSVESAASLSFSPNIELERKEDLGARLVRPTSTFLLAGGLIGLLAGLLVQLIRITPKRGPR